MSTKSVASPSKIKSFIRKHKFLGVYAATPLLGLSAVSLYGLIMAFVLKTMPVDSKAADPKEKQLKQAILGVFVVMVVLLVTSALFGSKVMPSGLKKTGLHANLAILLIVMTGLSSLTLIAGSLAYTQAPPVVLGNKTTKDLVLSLGIVLPAVGVVACGLPLLVDATHLKDTIKNAHSVAKNIRTMNV
jgi:hypothetical protein